MNHKFKIGFEIEAISTQSSTHIQRHVSLIDSSIIAEQDGSISTIPSHPYDVEIVTAPQEPKRALRTLKQIFEFMEDKNLQTNKSCGFHVNISCANKSKMQKMNPEMLIAATDDLYIADFYKRSKNEYCIPWSSYVKRLDTFIKAENRKNRYYRHNLRTEFSRLVYNTWDNAEFYDDYPSSVVGSKISNKNVSINIGYLEPHGYVEYRMLGGRNYQKNYSAIEDAIDHFMMGQLIALNNTDEQRIQKYLEWCTQ